MRKPSKKTKQHQVARIPFAPFAWGARRCTLTYAEQFQLDAGIGTIAQYVFVANGLYDPNYTSTGHQPYGFDQAMALYNHYTVLRASLEVVPNAPGGDISIAYGATVSGSAADMSGMTTENAIEHPGTGKYQVLARYSNPRPVAAFVDLQKFFGSTNIVGKDPFRGTASSNPDEQAFLNFWAGGLGSSDPANNTFSARLHFDVVFTEPRTLSSS